MIYTLTTKLEQLKNGFFSTGTGPLKVLVLGSCRTMPYLNYLARWNETDNGMTIRYINPVDWSWNLREEELDLEVELAKLETDQRILDALASTDIFVHEHFGNFGMFNTSREAEKNIYQFWMKPGQDISVPNFHDHFILYDDFKAFNALTDDWMIKGDFAVRKFCTNCKFSSFPEMADYFMDNWKTVRLFWTPNHISAAFSLYIFHLMNAKFLHLSLTEDFWQQAGGEDMFCTPSTAVTQHDRDAYGLTWSH